MNDRGTQRGLDTVVDILPARAAMGEEPRPSHRLRLPEISLAFSERKLLLFAGDAALLNLALMAAMSLAPRMRIPFALATLAAHPLWFATLTALWWFVATVQNAYSLKVAASRVSGPVTALKALVVAAVVYFFVPYWSAPLTSSRLAWLMFLAFAGTGVALWRLAYAAILVQPEYRQRALIVGAGRSGRDMLRAIQAGYLAEYDVRGFIDDDPAKRNTCIGSVPIAGNRDDLLRLVQEQDIHKVILAITHPDHIHADLFRALMACYELGVDVSLMVRQYEKLTGRVPVEHIGHQLYSLLPLSYSPVRPLYQMGTRVFNLACALSGLVGFALVLPVIAVLIRLDSPGPIFFRQTRVGKGGRPFQVLKLRTMRQDAEQPGEARWAHKDDDRVTHFGRWARKTRLDEVPQLWNVLKGEMNLVGPRPERPELVCKLQAQIPFYRNRHVVKPGITGWAQVNQGYTSSVDDTLVKLQYDLYYIKYRSFALDLIILARTLGTVLSFSGV